MAKNSRLTLISFTLSIIIFLILFFTFSTKKNLINFTNNSNKAFVFFHDLKNTKNKANLILKDQLLIFDSKPIFIPTKWTASSDPFQNIANNTFFNDFPPIITLYNENNFLNTFNETVGINSPIDLLNHNFINPFIGINQNTPNFLLTHQPTAHITIQSLDNPNILETHEITEKPNFEINDQLWAPLEFLLITDESSPILPLLLIQSSGTEQIDNFFKSLLSSPKSVLSSLAPGYYKIIVSP